MQDLLKQTNLSTIYSKRLENQYRIVDGSRFIVMTGTDLVVIVNVKKPCNKQPSPNRIPTLERGMNCNSSLKNYLEQTPCLMCKFQRLHALKRGGQISLNGNNHKFRLFPFEVLFFQKILLKNEYWNVKYHFYCHTIPLSNEQYILKIINSTE